MQLITPLGFFLLCCLHVACGQQSTTSAVSVNHGVVKSVQAVSPTVGAERINAYVPLLLNKRVGIVANQTSIVGGVHLVDTLMSLHVNVASVFAPEHGFRGDAGAGETIRNGIDAKTGLKVFSLYGQTKKPTAEMLANLDVVIFDIQDVGARFYTYLSTLHYVMEACAENDKELIVLDRPNPNGFYIDGPVLNLEFKSFVGMHPIPVVHGCTLGEMAGMINGQKWLKNNVQCSVKVIACANYSHKNNYLLPIRPSPNLPNAASVYLYPSLCFFEGTNVSVGRGTAWPFQVIGYPGNTTGTFEFVPADIAHVVNNPPHEGKVCNGHHLTEFGEYHFLTSKQLYLEWLIGLYDQCDEKSKFFSVPDFFDKLAGSDQLRTQIQAGKTASEIRELWQNDLSKYKAMRTQYLLYEDF